MLMYRNVTGFIDEQDRINLQQAVLETSHVEGDVLEIGTLQGKSALMTYAVMASAKRLVLVDPFLWNSPQAVRDNLARYEATENIEIHAMGFEEFYASRHNQGRLYSHVLIDHDHSYASNRRAMELFWPQLSSGGIMSFHDYGHSDYPGVQRAVDEWERDQRDACLYLRGFMYSLRKVVSC